jgi:Putative porin
MKYVAFTVLVGAILFSSSAIGLGAPADIEIQDLRKALEAQNQTIQKLLERISALESSVGSVGPINEKGHEQEKERWVDRIGLSGDLRFRHEWIDDARKDRDRQRQRIRARIGMNAEVNDEVDVHLQLSTGPEETYGADPVSGNQTLSGMWSGKSIWLTQAWFDYHPDWAPGLSIQGGKIKRPFITPMRSELIWDGDVNPEGALVKYKGDISEDTSFTLAGYGFWTMERSSDADSGIFGAQAAVKHSFEEFSVGGGLGYFDYIHPTDGSGAKIDEDDLDYELLNAWVEFNGKIADLPVTAYVDWVQNSGAADDDTGWAIGAMVGKAKKPGQCEGKIIYRHAEKNSVFPALTASDFGGGGANAEGFELGFKVNMAKHWDFGAKLFINDTGISSDDEEESFRRVQLDLLFKF